MRIVQLLASPSLGGPEWQVLGLARTLRPDIQTRFLSFAERGLARPFLNEARAQGFEAVELVSNAPRLWRAAREVAEYLQNGQADLLCCNNYKADIIGWLAAGLSGIPVIALSHGWTGVTAKVRLNEAIDRRVLRWMEAVVCVSESQATKVRAGGVDSERVHVIPNAIDAEAIPEPDPAYREQLHAFFPESPQVIVGTAGRLSPEKGFEVLVDAAAVACAAHPGLGFVLFGEGPSRCALEQRIQAHGLERRFVLAGFRADVRRFLPHLDLFAMSSFTEGLPVALLEAFAAGLPVVATAVGGIPEVIDDGVHGFLVPPGDAEGLAQRILALTGDHERRRACGERGRERVKQDFSLSKQSEKYAQLITRIVQREGRRGGKLEKREWHPLKSASGC